MGVDSGSEMLPTKSVNKDDVVALGRKAPKNRWIYHMAMKRNISILLHHSQVQTVISSWAGETNAYMAEREFQMFEGFETQFVSEDDMMVHIWSNYSK